MEAEHYIRYPGESEGLNNWIARETTRVPMSKYSRLHSAIQETPSAVPSRSGSERKSEKDRDRSGGKPSFHRWPLLKSKSSRTEIRDIFFGAKEPQNTSTAPQVLSSTSNYMPPSASELPKRPELLCSKKRKASVPDISLPRMTTVQEGLLDSPTLPLHHPFLERSLSYPEFGLRRLSEEGSEKTPRVSDFPTSSRLPLATSEKRQSWEKTACRRSSVMMQKELMPLIIPSGSSGRSALCAYRASPPNRLDGMPPQVPPKSPRTESRASPRPKQVAHSASSSTSTIHSVNSSATSVSSMSGKASPQLSHHVYRTASPAYQRDGLNKGEGQSSGVPRKNPDRSGAHTPLGEPSLLAQPHISHIVGAYQDRIGRQTPPLVESSSVHREISNNPEKTGPLGLRTNPDQSGSSSRERKPEDRVKEIVRVGHVACAKPLWHHRGASEASVLNRGRPMTRGDTPLVQKLNKTALRGPPLREAKSALPTGFRVNEVSSKFLDSDLKVLKQQADERITTFEVLSIKDVSNLSKELTLLNERCEYLHRTHTSLRQGRNGLHSRMILYLKTPQLTKFSRESILKQEEALAELDFSIDDWVSKLEQAEDRRNRIQQKLLEHFAAASTLQTTPASPPVHDIGMMHTPPTSPENSEDVYSRERHDVQSIKVYADSGVAALLAAIEQEIDLAAPSSPPS